MLIEDPLPKVVSLETFVNRELIVMLLITSYRLLQKKKKKPWTYED